MFLGSLMAVAERADGMLTEETRRALEQSLRYFREAAPKHTADEEESLFPRMRAYQDDRVQGALQKLKSLEEDHRWAEPLHAAAEDMGNEYLREGHLSAEKVDQFRNAVKRLVEMYRRHIEVEDREIFPVAAEALTAKDKAEIAREMAERRGLSPMGS